MKTSSQEDIRVLIKKARNFHGHLGPFLVLGVRIGLAGMKTLRVEENKRRLFVEADLPIKVPYTCTLDGIQVTTQCTVGNRRLTFRNAADSHSISAKFSLKNSDKKVLISLKEEVLRTLINKLKTARGNETTQEQLAWSIATSKEEELFQIKIQ